jgi:hypothetical protein
MDYAAQTGTLIFPPGTTNLPIAVTVYDDDIVETNETFTINLATPTNATIARGKGTGTILDNDYKITSVRIAGTNLLISFTTLTGRTSRLEYMDACPATPNFWQPLPGAINIRGSGGIMTATNLGGMMHSNRFYRVRLLP